MGDADAIHRHPIDCGLEGGQKFRYIQLLDVLDGDHIPVVRDRLSIKANRVGDTDGEIAIGAQVKLRIVKAVKIVDGCRCTKSNSLDLLKIDEICLLRAGRHTAKAQAIKTFLQRLGKTAGKSFCSVPKIYAVSISGKTDLW